MTTSLNIFFFQALTLTCLGLHYNSMAEQSDQHTIMLVNGTFVGFSIILVGLFAGYIMNTPINKRIGKMLCIKLIERKNKKSIFSDLFFSIVGCILFITSGVLILQFWNESTSGKIIGFASNDRKSVGITKGSLAVINGVLFLVDVVFTFRD